MKRKLLAILTSTLLLCTMLPLGAVSVNAATTTGVGIVDDTGLNADFVFLANNYPQYLNNNLAQTCTDFCLESCNDVIQSYDKKNTWLLAYAECFVNGTGILIQELGSKLGITQSVEEEWLQKNTMEYLRLVSGCEDIIYDEWNNVAKKYKDFKFVLKNVDELDTELINEQKNLFIKQMSDYSSCFSEDEIAEIADSLISKEPNGIKKFFSNADHVVDLADALLLSCQMAEVEDAVLKRLRSNIDANTPLYDGITSVLKANAAHPARWVLEKYLSDQALDWIENELMDAAWDWSAGLLGVENLNVATLVVEITATILYEYVYQGAKIDELYGALVAYDFYLTVSNALMQQQLAILQYRTNNQIVPEQTLSEYIFLYEAKRKAMLHYTEACINIDKTGYDSILENYQSYYEDDGQLVFDNYITICMGQLKRDIDAGKVTVENTHIVHNYSTYVYYEAAHPHYKCYQCLCGDVRADYSEPTVVSTCPSCVSSYEYAMFPMTYLNITQGVNGSFSHQGTKAIDIAGKDAGIDAAYAPFTGVIKRIYQNYVVWFESSNPVVFADGTIDYMTIMVMHDNDTSDLYVGKEIKQGEHFFDEGTTGYATGNHIHLECAKGKFQGTGWYENSNGNWVIYNHIEPYNALFLSSNTVVTNGYGYSWKYVTPSTPHTHNYNTYVYYWAEHPHYKCYQCFCGDVAANYSEPTHVSGCSSCTNSHEYAMFPMTHLNITQGVNGSFSHQGTKAIDIAGKDTGIDAAYAPFTGVVKRIYQGYVVWLESSNPVVFADGTIDYMTIMVMHDNDTSDLYVGKEIKQGEHFFDEGTTGYATGNHIHLECAKGKFQGNGWYENSNGNWVIYNSVNPYDALHLSNDTVVTNGYGYNWKTISTTPSAPAPSAKLPDPICKPVREEIFMLKNAAYPSMFLNVYAGKDANATKVVAWEIDLATKDQQFSMIHLGDGSYYFQAAGLTNRVLDIYWGSNNVVDYGDTLQVWTKGEYDETTTFNVVPVGANKYAIELKSLDNAVLTMTSGQNNSTVTLQNYTGSDAQHWYFCDLTGTIADPSAGDNHAWDNGVETTAATCSSTGVMTYTCTACGLVDLHVIPVANHTYDNACDTDCNGCGEVREVAGHVYDNDCDIDCNECCAVREVEHNFCVDEVEATCSEYGKRCYICEVCGYYYEEVIADDVSDWSEEYPSDVEAELIESKVEYRYREWIETTEPLTEDGWILDGTYTRMGEYGAWSNWTNSAITDSDNTQVETRTVYPYYYYKCPNCGAHMHVYLGCYTWAGGCGKSGINSGHYVQIDSTVPYSSAGLQDFHGTGRNYTYLDGQLVFQHRDGSKTQYRSRTREVETVYKYYRYTDWSDWSEECNAANAMLEERTVYRYVIAGLADHTYDDEYDADCNECGAIREVPDKPVDTVHGDANGDGAVNARDAALLQQYVAGWDATLDEASADANGDGSVNARDAALLQQYVAGWDVELG